MSPQNVTTHGLTPRSRFVWLLACLVLPACSEGEDPENPPILDQPTDMAFGCYGRMRVTGGAAASPEQPIVASAMPVEACDAWYRAERGLDQLGDAATYTIQENDQELVCEVPQARPVQTVPPGQEELEGSGPGAPELLGFVLQPAQGTVALVRTGVGTTTTNNNQTVSGFAPRIADVDTGTPGLNAIPVGVLPVDIMVDQSGCYATTANAGSCDLSAIDINKTFGEVGRPVVQRLKFATASGQSVGAIPRAMIPGPELGAIGYECPAGPQGLAYIAYPDCNTVAVIDLATLEVVAGVQFAADGTPTVRHDGELPGCTGTCGGVIASGGTAPRPVALAIKEGRLYVGAENSATLWIFDLGQASLPLVDPSGHVPITVEGNVGLTQVAVTDLVNVNGSGNRRFAYAIATDSTVRVLDVSRVEMSEATNYLTECDTQVDTRYLHDECDVARLACLPVGDPLTPPRRALARSPGIDLPGDAAPLSVAFGRTRLQTYSHRDINGASEPNSSCDDYSIVAESDQTLYFAYISTSAGSIVPVKLRDDEYADAKGTNECGTDGDPYRVDIALALPHRMVDANRTEREFVPESCTQPASQATELLPRSGAITSNAAINYLPVPRQLLCETDDSSAVVTELSIVNEGEVRRAAFPDFTSASLQEIWSISWEGPLSRDTDDQAIDGPSTRFGWVQRDEGGLLALIDSTHPFCELGVEDYDIVEFVGCNPRTSDNPNAQCSLGEICYVPDDSPFNLGLCIPETEVETLADTCSGILTTRRRFSVANAKSDKLVLMERRRVLTTTPLGGCTDSVQCNDLYNLEQANLGVTEPTPRTLVCEPDPSRRSEDAQCLMTCTSDSDCETGWACSNNYCVESPLPAPECLATLQRYRVRAGEAFAVVGTASGYLHDRIRDPATGECTDDPTASPLLIGRIPIEAPPCEGDGLTDVLPNPCATTVDHVRSVSDTDAWKDECKIPDPGDSDNVLLTLSAPAIRFRNPAFTFHLAEPHVSGLFSQCANGLSEEELRLFNEAAVPFVVPDYEITLQLVGGYAPLSYVLQYSTLRIVYPRSVISGPTGRLWVTDQGDTSSSVRGQIVHFIPGEIDNVSSLNYLR